MEYYSAIKNNDYMKFLSKWIKPENIILNEATQPHTHTNTHTHTHTHTPKNKKQKQKQNTYLYAFPDKWILAQSLRIPKI
jgi:ABC-type nickel/cobalt efflux system permease component RcnA